MSEKTKSIEDLLAENESLRLRLQEAEEALLAISSGDVDALVIDAGDEPRIFTLQGADHPYRVLVETMHEGAVTVDAEGAVAYCNDRFASMLEKPLQRVIGTHLREYVAPQDAAALAELLSAAVQGAAVGDLILLTAEGEKVPVHASSVRLDLGATAGASVIFTDLSEIKRKENELAESVARLSEEIEQRAVAEEVLRKNEALLRTVLETLPVGVAIFDAEGTVTYLNPAVGVMWGGEKRVGIDDYIRYKAWRHGTDQLLAAEEYPAAIALSTGKPVVGHMLDVETFDGERKNVLASAAPFLNEDGKVYGIVGVMEDITQQQVLQKQLLQAQKMETVGRLAGGIAHDFNNLLMVLKGFSEEALELTRDPNVAELLQHVVNAGEKARKLTYQLLTFSRQQKMQATRFDLVPAVEEMARLFRRVIEENVRIVTNFSDEPLPLEGDQGQIEQTITNIVVNARDAMPNGGELRLSVHAETVPEEEAKRLGLERGGKYAVVEIADTGTGIPPEHLARIFDPFFTTKEVGRGTGLGLSIAYGVVKQHYGAIGAQSLPGGGSVFRIHLPLAQEAVPEASKGVQPQLRRGQGEMILVVEDDPTVLLFVRLTLEKAGYRILQASDGEKALKMAIDNDIAAVVSDVMMPKMSGMTLYEKLSRIKPGLAMILMSGYSSDIVPKDLADHVVFLQKPVSPAMLTATLRQVLLRPKCS